MSLVGGIISATKNNPAAIKAATRASLELVVSSAVGIASIDRGLLDSTTVKALSRATFTILLPLFLGNSVLKTVTKYGLSKSSLALPALAAVQSLILYTFTTRVLYPLFRIDLEDASRGTAVCASFGNGGTVPLIFCDALFRNNIDNLALSTGFVSMFLVGWSPFFWSFGRSVLLGSNNSSNGERRAIGGKEVDTSSSLREKIELLLTLVKGLMPPPVMGVLIGMTLATVPILRDLFVTSSSSRPAIFGVVLDTAQNFGKAANPMSLLILVSSLALGAGFGQKTITNKSTNIIQSSSSSSSIPFWKRWTIVSLSRFVVSPLLMLGLLRITSAGKVIGTALEQPMLWFVCMLEASMPPAQNQVVMLQVANKSEQANEMATFLFTVYATSMIPLTIIVSIALHKLKLL